MNDGPENRLALRHADQARADFYAIADDLEFIKSQLTRLPTRKDMARIALITVLACASLTIALMALFFGRGF